MRPAPEDYKWVRSVEEAKIYICFGERTPGSKYHIELIDIDHDAGDYASNGGDYIKLLDWLEETGRNYPIHIHTDNAVARERMRAIIQRNDWKEIR